MAIANNQIETNENKNKEKEVKQYIVVQIGSEKYGIDISYVDNIVLLLYFHAAGQFSSHELVTHLIPLIFIAVLDHCSIGNVFNRSRYLLGRDCRVTHCTGKCQHNQGLTARFNGQSAGRILPPYPVGDMDMVEKIQNENWFDFDVVVASPDMMGVVGRLGKVLGPKGLMPSWRKYVGIEPTRAAVHHLHWF